MKSKDLKYSGVFLAVFCLAAMSSGGAHAEDESGGQKHYGVIHNIAEDRQVERVGGIYEPEGIDKYMKRRFDAIDERLTALESRFGEVLAQLEEIKAMVGDSKKSGQSGSVLVSRAGETNGISG